VQVDDRGYPFSREDQVLTWRRETIEELLALFRELTAIRRPAAAACSSRRAPGCAQRAAQEPE